MRPRRPLQRRDHEPVEYWMSYSDLMAGLLLVFIMLLVGTLFILKRDLEHREKQIQQAEAELEETRIHLKKMNTDVADILGVRAEIIERLKAQFKKTGSKIHFDDATGAVRLGSSILFQEGSHKLTARGRRTLEEFVPVYYEALLGDPKLRKHVGQILFEGHTNSNYSNRENDERAYLFNLQLSQARAYSAMEHVVERGVGASFKAEKLLAANGYSSSRLLYQDEAKKVEDKEASRRLEIRFRLRDEEALDRLRELLDRLEKKEAGDAR